MKFEDLNNAFSKFGITEDIDYPENTNPQENCNESINNNESESSHEI